jgi:hypothetical protein
MTDTRDDTHDETRDVTTRDLAERASDEETQRPTDTADTAAVTTTEPVDETSRNRGEEPAASDSLLAPDEGERFRSDWETIQARFVDEPRSSVESADTLVADLMQRLATSFTEERARLERQWDSGDDVSTEELRVTLTRYRSFFERLLSA